MSYEAGNTGIAGDGDEFPKLRLLDEVRRRLRVKHYSLRTETVYVGWIKRFIVANGRRHPSDSGVHEVEVSEPGTCPDDEVAHAPGERRADEN